MLLGPLVVGLLALGCASSPVSKNPNARKSTGAFNEPVYDAEKPFQPPSFPYAKGEAVSGTYERPPFVEKAGFGAAEFVLVLGFDGLGSVFINDDFRAYPNLTLPGLDKLRAEGAWTLHSRALMPLSSKPNWCGMLTAAGPEETGVFSNDWYVGSQLEPLTGKNTYFPSIYQAIRDQRPGWETALYSDWRGVFDCLPREIIDHNVSMPIDAVHFANVMVDEVIMKRKSRFMFTHIDDLDYHGHRFAWGSAKYLAAVQRVDTAITIFRHGLERAGIADKTLIIVTSDHGGTPGTLSHGANDAGNFYTPLIIHGPGVKKGFQLACPTRGYSCYSASRGRLYRNLDTASIAAYALGLQQPDLWIGTPALDAWEEKQKKQKEEKETKSAKVGTVGQGRG